MYPAPLPHIGLVLNVGPKTLTAAAGSFSLTGKDATLGAPNRGGDPAPFPHIGLLLGRPLGITCAAGSFTLTGKAAGKVRTYVLTAAAGSFTLTGVAASLKKFKGITASAGSFAVAGKAALFARPVHILYPSAGAFTLTGKAAALKRAKRLYANAGAFTLTGVGAGLSKSTSGALTALYPGPFPQIGMLLYGAVTPSVSNPAPLPIWSTLLGGSATDKYLIAAAGAFSVSGKAASLLKGKSITAETGTFTVSGAPAERDIQITAAAGSFSLSGVSAQLIRSHPSLTANKGSYVLAGLPVGMRYVIPGSYSLSGLPGVFTVTGVAATLRPTPHLDAAPGAFTVQSSGADLRYSGEKKYGKSRKRKTYERKYVVEVDGQEFVVESAEEARDLLAAAVETAQEVVNEVRKEPVALTAPKIVVKGPKGPELNELVADVSETRDRIRALYNDLQQLAEISRLLQEQDEEEAILALI